MNADSFYAHSAACGFFARIFRAGLDAELLRRCAREHVIGLWPRVGEAGATLDGVFSDLNEAALTRIERDNTVLFIGPENPVPMWESVWTTKDRLLFADCAEAVRQAFAGAGLEAPNAGHEPADHLAFELAFLATLLARAGQALEAGEAPQAHQHAEAARAFLAEHPAKWAAACLDEIGRRAGTDFYRAASVLCADTLTGLQEALATA